MYSNSLDTVGEKRLEEWLRMLGFVVPSGGRAFGQTWTHPRASHVALVGKNLPASAGDIRDSDLTPELGRSPGGGHGNPLQCYCLENPHGQRNLAGYSPWGCRGRPDWATKLITDGKKTIKQVWCRTICSDKKKQYIYPIKDFLPKYITNFFKSV